MLGVCTSNFYNKCCQRQINSWQVYLYVIFLTCLWRHWVFLLMRCKIFLSIGHSYPVEMNELHQRRNKERKKKWYSTYVFNRSHDNSMTSVVDFNCSISRWIRSVKWIVSEWKNLKIYVYNKLFHLNSSSSFNCSINTILRRNISVATTNFSFRNHSVQFIGYVV